MANFTKQTVQQQLANRSGQISIRQENGGWQFVDDLTGKPISSLNAASSVLANPQRPNDPKIKAKALDIARGLYGSGQVPAEILETIATVAAYVSATRNVPVTSLFTPTGVSIDLIEAYNALKSKTSQVGVFLPSPLPVWANNPTLRGSVSAAITDSR